VAVRCAGGGECGVVIDGGGATRMVWRHEVRQRLRVEDEQERKKLDRRGYIKIRSLVNLMRQRR
jgi:hypothetical protein